VILGTNPGTELDAARALALREAAERYGCFTGLPVVLRG
jgi:hypothetical protein